MYKSQKGAPFYTTLKYLESLGQIPMSSDKSKNKKFFIVFLSSKFLGFFLTAVGPILHLVISIISESDVDITENVSICLGATGAGIVAVLFVLKYEEWSKFFRDLTDVKQFGKPTTLDETANFLNRCGKFCFFSASWVTIIYGAAAWYNSKGCDQTDTSFDQICPVFSPIWLPVGTNNLTVGYIIFSLQVIFMGLLIAQPFFMICFIMYESTEILISHIDGLKYHLRVVFDVESMNENRDNFRFCVNYHNHILELGYRLNKLIKSTAGHMTLLAAVLCACITNQMITTKPMGSLVYLAAWLTALFAFCHSGQRIRDQTLSIAEALLDSKWYTADARTQKDVQFILLRCQKPITFEAVPFGILDYSFYYVTIKTGYSYFTLLN